VSQKIQTIFLVDDDVDDQLLFQEALSETDNSIQFICASNGIDAIEKLTALNNLPCVIFMDVNMPKMNGIDCLKELQKRQNLKNIPVIMYSTSCTLGFQKECFASGAVDYIEKPYDFWQLRNMLQYMLVNGIRKNNVPI